MRTLQASLQRVVSRSAFLRSPDGWLAQRIMDARDSLRPAIEHADQRDRSFGSGRTCAPSAC